MSLRALALPFLLLLPACQSAPSRADSAPAVAASDSKKPAADLPDEVRADLDMAQREAAIAVMDVEFRRQEARVELENARRAVQKAERELGLLDEQTSLDLAESQLSVDRDAFRLEESRAELAELEAMYQQEEFAKTTKELVLTRGRRQVEMAEKDLAIGEAQLDHKKRATRSERADKEAALEDANFAAQKAEHALKKLELETELELLRSNRKVQELQAKLAEKKVSS